MKMVEGLLKLSCLQQYQKMVMMMNQSLSIVRNLKCIPVFRHLYSSLTKRPLPSNMSGPPPTKLRKITSHSLKECTKTQLQSIQDHSDAQNHGSHRFDLGNVMGMKDILHRVFAFIDEDCDGRLSLDEIRVFLHQKMGISISGEELQALALISCSNAEIDMGCFSSSSSFMDLSHFESILTGDSGILGHLQKEEEEDVFDSFCVFDSDGDGFICAKELQSCLRKMGFMHDLKTCQAIISTLDSDGNGLLDFSEFNQMMNAFNHPPSSSSYCSAAASSS